MKKKIAAAVITTAYLASMAAPAFADPNGLYYGSKFYSEDYVSENPSKVSSLKSKSNAYYVEENQYQTYKDFLAGKDNKKDLADASKYPLTATVKDEKGKSFVTGFASAAVDGDKLTIELNKKFTLTKNNVKIYDGTKSISGAVKDVSVNDKTATVTLDPAKLTGGKTYKIYYNSSDTRLTFDYQAAQQVTVTSINAIPDVTVDNGTTADKLGLPAKVTVSTSDNKTAQVAVAWDTAGYDGTKAGTYTLSGALTMPEGITNPQNLKASVKVIVKEAVVQDLKVASVSAIDARMVEVTLNRALASGETLTKDNFGINLKNSSSTKFNVKTVSVDGAKVTLDLESSLTSGSTYVVSMTSKGATTSQELAFKDVTRPTISDIQVIDSKHLVVTLSERVSATAATDFTVRNTTAGQDTALGGSDTVTLGTDGRTLRMTLNTALTDADYTLFVDTATATTADLAGNAMAQYHGKAFKGVSTVDTVAPKVVKASYSTSTKTITVDYDEVVDAYPVTNVGVTKFSITNGTTSVALTASDYATNAADSSSLTLKLSDATAASVAALSGNFSLKWESGAVKDLSGNLVDAGTSTVSVVKAPKVNSASYDQAGDLLTITFDQDVRVASEAIAQGKIKYTADNGSTSAAINANANATIVTTSNSSSVTFKLSASDAAAIEATTTANLELILDAGAFESVAGDKNDAVVATDDKKITFTADTVAPSVSSATYNDLSNVLTIKFSERINPSSKDLTKISITDGSTTVALNSDHNVAESSASDTLTINIASGTSKEAAVEALDLSKALLIVAKGAVKDPAGNDVTAVASTDNKGIVVTDLTPPTLATNGSWGAKARSTNATTAQVYFSEKLDPTTVVPANFTIYPTSNSAALLSITSAYLDGDGRTVTLVTGTQEYGLGYTVEVSANIADLKGNKVVPKVAGSSTTTFTGGAGVDLTGPQLASSTSAVYSDKDSSLSVSAGDTITLSFNEPVTVGSLSVSDFQVDLNGGDNGYSVVTTEFGSNPSFAKGTSANDVVITLGSGSTIVPGTTDIKPVASHEGIKDLAGNNVTAAQYAVIQSPDSGAPSLTSVVYTDNNASGSVNAGDYLTLTFNKQVDLVTGSDFAKDWFASSPTIDGTGFAIATVAGQPNQLKVTLGSNAGNDDIIFGTTTLELAPASMDAPAGIFSKWGTLATTATTPVKITSADTVKPTLQSVLWHDNNNNNIIDANDQMTFIFSEPVSEDATGATLAGFYAVGGTASPSFGTTSATLDPVTNEPTKMIVTLVGSPALYAGATKVGVDAGVTQHIQDASDNLITYSSEVSIVKDKDLVGPTAHGSTPIAALNGGVAASVDAGDKITIKFNEKVKVSNITLANLALSSHAWGNATIAQNGTGDYDDTFVITLGSTSTVAGSETITLNKTNAVDEAGNVAASNITFTVPAAASF
ncbi:hypothetical protein GJ688_11530 [Heliobacillus mobilis]|uniref:Uncharacterized protein n=1 Tax=Heliobacterium mobile TaxID=28064 RepID=A0A6I3SKW8_HELMO|nr:Ig-like domain-containing protein [Heliobacterium mobile]MTV49608.1 hypothetical protein [Heliobacterium mobile]